MGDGRWEARHHRRARSRKIERPTPYPQNGAARKELE